jgi:CHAT domain-containing protein
MMADLRRSADDLGVKGFRRLPESGREAEALLALAPRRKSFGATGFAASRRMVLTGALSRYKIIHIATHGLIHPTHPELSGLVLSLVDEHGKPQDGFLRSYELQEMDLPADLVVLSACQTALGKEVPGEGLVGLTRVLMQAGARRLVVSLWSVEDASTAELMSRFYRAMLRQGLSPSAALREAQLSMLRDPRWSDPRYWAPFIFQGDWH